MRLYIIRPMRYYLVFFLLASRDGLPPLAADEVDIVKKAVERSTLNQHGTKSFHLKGIVVPTRDRDDNSGRTGEIEIWWESPTRRKREVRSPDFHQVAIVNGRREWQKNDGGYFPEWPLEGLMTAEVVVDRSGSIRDVGSILFRLLRGRLENHT